MNTLKRLFRLFAPYWGTLVLSAALLLLRAGTELVPPLVQKRLIDTVIEQRDLSNLGVLIGTLVGVYALQEAARALDMYQRHALGERFIYDLRVSLYAYLQRLSLSFFECTSTGELMSRVTNDISALEHFVTHGTAMTAVNLIRLVGGVGILLWLDWRLALWVLLPIPVLAVSLRLFNERVRPIYRRARDRLGDINARLQDSLSGIQVIQAFGQEERDLKRFAVESENYYRTQLHGIRY
jgi:ATP-binding cassette subfamily B protein